MNNCSNCGSFASAAGICLIDGAPKQPADKCKLHTGVVIEAPVAEPTPEPVFRPKVAKKAVKRKR